MEVRYTLLAEGSSDSALLPILDWCIRQRDNGSSILSQRADFGHLRHPPKGLTERILKAIDLFPCDLLFIHRDADAQPFQNRHDEISTAVAAIPDKPASFPRHVCVVPIRMTEVWLLTSDNALRHAAGNPNGTAPLNLPPVNRLERHADPKRLLSQSLEKASGLRSRNLKKFSASRAVHNISNHITDFASLRQLGAFRKFEADLAAIYP